MGNKAPVVPADVKADKIALAKWKELYPILAKSGTFEDRDRDLLERYCLEWSDSKRLRKACEENGEYAVSAAGVNRQEPWARDYRVSLVQLNRLAFMLGMGVRSRGGVNPSLQSVPNGEETPEDYAVSKPKL